MNDVFRMCMDCQYPLTNDAAGKTIIVPNSQPMLDRSKWPPNTSHGLCPQCLAKRLSDFEQSKLKPNESFKGWFNRQ